MEQSELSAIIGVITSLAFSYFPFLAQAFDALEGNVKRLIQVALGVIVTAAVFGLSCAGIMETFVCEQDGIMSALRTIGAFLIANQGAYMLTPKAKQ